MENLQGEVLRNIRQKGTAFLDKGDSRAIIDTDSQRIR